MDTKQFIGLYTDLFRGRQEFYAIRKEFPDRAIYVPSTYDKDSEYILDFVADVVEDIGTEEYGTEAVTAHMMGRYFLGVYPIQADSTVNFFALDFDGGDGDPWKEAVHQAKILEDQADLPVYIERSRSGNGYHVWGFLDEPVHAGTVRHALKPYLLKTDTFDRMFPNQDEVGKGLSHGNLIALPLYGPNVGSGGGVFVQVGPDGEAEEIEDQKVYLREVEKISLERIEDMFEEAGEYIAPREIKIRDEEVDQISGIHKVVHPLLGCEWIRWCWECPDEVMDPEWHALACQLAQLEDGREWFHKFSERDGSRYNEKATDLKFNHALRQNKPHGCAYIQENLGGPGCHCDERFPGEVYHPYDLAKLPFHTLIAAVELEEDALETVAHDAMDALIEYLEAVQNDPTIGQGIPFGIDVVDEHFGFRGGEITLLAARNSIGKTALALYSLRQVVMRAKKAGKLYSMEMTKRQIMMRMVADMAEVSQRRMKEGILTDGDWKRIQDAKTALEGIPLGINDFTTDLDQMIDSAAEFVLEHGEESVIFVDYLQILKRHQGENEQDVIYRAATAFKQFAKVLNCHVVLLSQLNREADGADTDTVMRDSMLRGSDVQAFVADNILMLLGEKGPGTVERVLRIHKQRNGEAGVQIPLEFNQPLMKWGEQGSWLKIGAAYTNMEEFMDTPGGSPISPPTFEDLDMEEEDEEHAAMFGGI